MRRGVRIPDRSEITADTPLSLDVAARIAFPDGLMSCLALRDAATRGDLGHAKLGGRVYTTLADIERTVAACWIKAEPRRSGRRGAPAKTAKDEEARRRHGGGSAHLQRAAAMVLEGEIEVTKWASYVSAPGCRER